MPRDERRAADNDQRGHKEAVASNHVSGQGIRSIGSGDYSVIVEIYVLIGFLSLNRPPETSGEGLAKIIAARRGAVVAIRQRGERWRTAGG